MRMSLILGDLEELILLSVQASRPAAQVTGIRNNLETHARHTLSAGAIDRVLRRLNKKGFAASQLVTSKPDGEGRKTRYWMLTKKGSTALERMENIRKLIRGAVA